jgi:DNA-directed RNA polymerase specialized sigma54-like protein
MISNNPLIDLSPQETEMLLGMYKGAWKEYMRPFVNYVKSQVPNQRYLEEPQIIIKTESSYPYRLHVGYSRGIRKRLHRELSELDKTNGYKRFLYDRKCIERAQMKIARYLVKEQSEYIKTEDPHHLKKMTQKSLGEHVGFCRTIINRLIRKVSIQLPSGNVIFIKELVPGAKRTEFQGIYDLSKYEDDELFGHGENKITDWALSFKLKEDGVDVKPRTANKYRHIMRSLTS